MKYVIGIGNFNMSDDAVGLKLVETISERGLDRGFEPVSLPHDIFTLLSYFNEDTEKIVIVDSVDFVGKPGDFLVFSPSDVESRKSIKPLTTHEGDVLKIITMGQSLGYPMPPIAIVGIQPLSHAQGLELSGVLKERFEEYLSAVLKAL